MTPIIAQLLEAINGASSKKPAIAADVRKKLGLHIDDFASVYQAALDAHLIYDARITRRGIEQLVCWPTGVILTPSRAIVINPKKMPPSGMLTRNVGGPTDAKAKAKPTQRPAVQSAIKELIASTSDALTINEMIERTGFSRQQVTNAVTRMRGALTAERAGIHKTCKYRLASAQAQATI